MRVAERHIEQIGFRLVAAVFLFPLVWMVGYAAVCSFGGLGSLSQGWTLRHWQQALVGGRLWQSLAVSAILSSSATAVAWLLAVGILAGLCSPRKDQRIQSLLYLPLALPPLAAGFIARLWLSRGGLISRLAAQLGLCNDIQDFPVLVQDRFGFALVLTLTCGSLPLLSLYLLRIWQIAKLDQYLSAALSLGARPGYAFRHIAVPMLWRRSGPVLLMVFLWNFSAWEVPLLLGRKSSPMLSVLIQQSSGQFVLDERPQAFVFAVVYFCLSATVVWYLSGRNGLRMAGRGNRSGHV